MFNYTKIAVLLVLILQAVIGIDFEYVLTDNKVQCFGDALGQFINVLGEITAYNSNVAVRVFNSKGEQLVNRTNESFIRFAFTTEDEGNIQICFANTIMQPARFRLRYVTGVDAKDYSALSSKQDFKPFEIGVKRLEDMMQTIRNEMKFLILKEDARILDMEDISFKIVGFSVITLGLITLLTVFQISYLKNFFRQKKLI